MTVARLDAEMGYDEYVRWVVRHRIQAQRRQLQQRMSTPGKGML